MLKTLDKEYCWNEESSTYCYEKRNHSTSHVHMMLSTALSNMIDNCECLIFLNTSSSISTRDIDESNKTDSPWIFSEIVTSKLIEKKKPARPSFEHFVEAANVFDHAALRIEYDANLTHLVSLNDHDLAKWINYHSKPFKSSVPALDVLYKIKGI